MSRLRTSVMFAALALAACGGEEFGDLRSWVKEQDNMPRPRIEPLPEVKPYEAFTYNVDDLIDPFKPRKVELPKSSNVRVEQEQLRRKEPLEAYPLESLKMVGTLQQNKQTYALVRTPDNNLFRVRTGNYLGQNFGRIAEISESSVQIKELVQDSSGDWVEHLTSLQLQEEQEVAKN